MLKATVWACRAVDDCVAEMLHKFCMNRMGMNISAAAADIVEVILRDPVVIEKGAA